MNTLHESLAEGAPIGRARAYGDAAEQQLVLGHWELAASNHRSAAREYEACLGFTQNVNLQTTLRMLHAEHAKAARELQRKAEDAARGPPPSSQPRNRALPAPPSGASPSQRSAVADAPTRPSGSRGSTTTIQRDVYRRYYGPGPSVLDGPVASSAAESHPTPVVRSKSSSSSLSLQGSQSMEPAADGSYMMLEASQLDPQDSFAVFFKAIEGMLDKFSQPVALPVAFATAPLVPQDSLRSSMSSPRKETRRETTSPPATPDPDVEDSDSDSDSSFFMIPSSSSSSSRSMTDSIPQYPPPLFQSQGAATETLRGDRRAVSHELKTENDELKTKISELSNKLRRAEEIIQAKLVHEQTLLESVNTVRREAQRAMAASASFGRASSILSHMPQPQQASLLVPGGPYAPYLPQPPSLSSRQRATSPEKTVASAVPILDPARDVASLARIKELESQVQALKADNENQRAQITRYRERWQKLKENAKRKQRMARDGVVNPGTPEKILEEDEGGKSDDATGNKNAEQ